MEEDVACSLCSSQQSHVLTFHCQILLTVPHALIEPHTSEQRARNFGVRVEPTDKALHVVGREEGGKMAIGLWLLFVCTPQSGAEEREREMAELECSSAPNTQWVHSSAAAVNENNKATGGSGGGTAEIVEIIHPLEGSVLLRRSFVLVAQLAFGETLRCKGDRRGGSTTEAGGRESARACAGDHETEYWWGVAVDGEEVSWQRIGRVWEGGSRGRALVEIDRLTIGEHVIRVVVGVCEGARGCRGGLSGEEGGSEREAGEAGERRVLAWKETVVVVTAPSPLSHACQHLCAACEALRWEGGAVAADQAQEAGGSTQEEGSRQEGGGGGGRGEGGLERCLERVGQAQFSGHGPVGGGKVSFFLRPQAPRRIH